MSGSIIRSVTCSSAHPDPARSHLDVITLSGGAQMVSMKLEDGSSRYGVGDLVVHLQAGSMLPESMLKRLDVWDEKTGKGRARGPLGNRLVASKFGGVMSDGMMLPVSEVPGGPYSIGDDVSAILEVVFWTP